LRQKQSIRKQKDANRKAETIIANAIKAIKQGEALVSPVQEEEVS